MSASASGFPRYRAFICYARADRFAAKELHRWLERYRVPRRLVGRDGEHGPVPVRLYPIFRDQDELAASTDLGERLRTALARSEFLLVLCSPAAAQSRWVNAEIETFRAVHPRNRDRVLAVIAASDSSTSAEPEACFPPALRGTDGVRGMKAGYPLAADFRRGRDMRRDAKLRLVAALLGLPFDELRQRDQERRLGVLRNALMAVGVIGLIFAGLAVFALGQREQARKAEARAHHARGEAEKLVDFIVTDLNRKAWVGERPEVLEPAVEKVLSYYETVAPEEIDLGVLQRRSAALVRHGLNLQKRMRGDRALAALRTAGALRQRMVRLAPADAGVLASLAETHRFIGRQLRSEGYFAEARRELETAKTLLRQGMAMPSSDAGGAGSLPGYALFISAGVRLLEIETADLSLLLDDQDPTAAVDEVVAGVDALAELAAQAGGAPALEHMVIYAAGECGDVLTRLGDYGKAERYYADAIARGEGLLARTPTNAILVKDLNEVRMSLGKMLLETARWEEGAKVLLGAEAELRKLAADDPTNLAKLDLLATAQELRGAVARGAGEFDVALTCMREAVELRERIVEDGGSDLRAHRRLALALGDWSEIEMAAGDGAQGVSAATKSVEILTRLNRERPGEGLPREDLVGAHEKLGSALRKMKRSEEAVEVYRAALEINDEGLNRVSRLRLRDQRARCWLGLARVLWDLGKTVDAAEAARESLAMFEQEAKGRAEAESILATAGVPLN